MSLCFRVMVGTCAVLCSIPPVPAQQTTQDGVRLENAVNKPDRPYRQAGSSDPRDRGPMVAKGFGRREGHGPSQP